MKNDDHDGYLRSNLALFYYSEASVYVLVAVDLTMFVNVHIDALPFQEYPTARVKLGDYHYYGWGTEPDYEMVSE